MKVCPSGQTDPSVSSRRTNIHHGAGPTSGAQNLQFSDLLSGMAIDY
jgi:hypothetical protein